MTYQVFKWPHDHPYQDKNKRQKHMAKKESRSPFPWSSMQPGDWFYIKFDSKPTQTEIKSQQNSVRNSAATHGIYIKALFTNLNGTDPKIKIIHDGFMKF